MNEIYNAFSSAIREVKKLCDLCGSTSHFTFEHFPEQSKDSQHVQDKPHKNLSRSSVPDGILIIENPNGPFVVTTQKFARGTRFGPILAPKSYIPVKDVKLPLIIFSNELEYNLDGEYGFVQDLPKEIQELFSVRNFYLDTTNEKSCNWLILVDVAKYSDEQNLMCYQENDQIFFTSTKDISMGDILKVWYAPNYAKKMGADLLPSAAGANLCTNIIQQVSFGQNVDLPDINDNKIFNSFVDNDCSPLMGQSLFANSTSSTQQSSEIFLPPVNSLMKNQSPVYDQSNRFSNLSQSSQNSIDFYFTSVEKDDIKSFQDEFSEKSTQSVEMFPTDVDTCSKYSPDNETLKQSAKCLLDTNDSEIHKYACEICSRKYITKTNLEKHMRSHNLFMCIFCMKMFPNPSELKEHDCFKFKTTAKKSLLHCSICLKVLSNAWSLQRHMKIHKNVSLMGSSVDDELKDQKDFLDIKSESLTSVPMENQIDESESQQSADIQGCGDQSAFEIDVNQIKIEASSSQMAAPTSSLTFTDITPVPVTPPTPINPSLPNTVLEAPVYTSKNQIIEKCVVCARSFKNPNSLEKHLRNVHTAHIIRPELTTSIKKSSEYRRVVLNNTKPIKDDVAKLLASKLNKKSQQQKLEECNKIASPDTTEYQPDQTTMINDQTTTEYHLDTLTPILLPVSTIDSTSTINLNNENEGAVFIISNADIENGHMFNNTISITKDNGIFISNFSKNEAALPKLVPISSHSIDSTKSLNVNSKKRSESGTDGSSNNGEILDRHDSKMEHSSPKVFIIDKNNEGSQKVQIDERNLELQEESFKCDRCSKSFSKPCQLKRHMDIHENLFYFCPFCKKAPVKARSSLRKHFFKEHADKSNIWQASNFMSKLLRKYDKSSPSASQIQLSLLTAEESPEKKVVRKYTKRNLTEKSTKTGASKSKKSEIKHCDSNVPKIIYLNDTKDSYVEKLCPTIISNEVVQEMERDDTKDILNDIQTPIKRDIEMNPESQSEQQIILHNLFLDSMSYSLNTDNDFMIDPQPNDSVQNDSRIDNNHSIESYEISDFRNFRNSFDEIQEKLDAELEFNTEPGLGLGLDLGLERDDVELNDESSLTESESQNSIINNEGTSFMLN